MADSSTDSPLQVTVALCRDNSLAPEQARRRRSGGGTEGLGASKRLELELAGVCLQVDLFEPKGQHARRVALSVHHVEVRPPLRPVGWQQTWVLQLQPFSSIALNRSSIIYLQAPGLVNLYIRELQFWCSYSGLLLQDLHQLRKMMESSLAAIKYMLLAACGKNEDTNGS